MIGSRPDRPDFGQTSPYPSAKCDFRLLTLLVPRLGQADSAAVHTVRDQRKQPDYKVSGSGQQSRYEQVPCRFCEDFQCAPSPQGDVQPSGWTVTAADSLRNQE